VTRFFGLLLSLLFIAGSALAQTSVTVAGSLQSELGCPNDWEPPCTATQLVYDAEDDVWQRAFDVPAGSYEYKAALNGAWDENYGAGAQPNGGNIGLTLDSAASVKFYYDHKSHWVTSNRNTTIVTAPGSYQSEAGCGGDWAPDCLRSWLQDPDGDGTFTMSLRLPAGDYETKAAIDESWNENYGAGGSPGGANIPFTVGANCGVTVFSYDSATHILSVTSEADQIPQPNSVAIPGSFQSELGCTGDWDPACTNTHLTYDAADGVWQGTYAIPAGNWEYKAAINGAWDENYGAGGQPNGSNLTLNLAEAGDVKFYYDHATHWVADNRSEVIATVPGSFQHFLGCGGDWQPDCLRSWLQDPDGDNIYTFSTRAIPAGSYEAKVAIGESWTENYGAGGARDGANIGFTVSQSCAETFFSYDATTHVLTISTAGAVKGNLAKAQAHWVTARTIAWDVPEGSFVRLHSSEDGDLTLDASGVAGGTAVALTRDPAGLPADVLAKFPHLAGLDAWTIPDTADVASILKGQIAVSAMTGDEGDSLVDATSLQIAGVLDDLYTYDGPLGITWNAGVPTFRVWAPTAHNVMLVLYDDPAAEIGTTGIAMTPDDESGVWSTTVDPSWYGKFYLYLVQVYVRGTGFVNNLVTDPYSVSLSQNSTRSQIVNLDDAALKPAGWDTQAKPPLDAPEDIALYELHVRDFSAGDATVPEEERGTFKAFTRAASDGMKHLFSLSSSGLTHVHLLPVFDIATINEDKSQWADPGDLSGFPRDSTRPQELIEAIRDQDGFNWGYDPWHYTVPEGSYSTDPAGTARIVEFREMVQSLSEVGLRTVMDVVYNHTNAAGQNPKSVLDRIVPGYYHRLNADGNVEMSSCCPNTATEHNMMEKLMLDSVLTWARDYKVDGFRFDLMGHHMKTNMTKLRARLDALTLQDDGVDGKKIYLYGEGWNFGEVANNARGVHATQLNMAGTGIGTFTDRLRDGVRGGGPFDDPRSQGFASGLWYDPNGSGVNGTESEQLATLLLRTDWVRLGMAGNLANYRFRDRNGNSVFGSQVDYNGQPAGYAADPQEIINYVEAHDNETLYDALVTKLPVTLTMEQRVRAQIVALSTVALAQGIPFFHAGSEILRSKSLDRNSYNSGDWFNRLDWTYTTNNFGVGLPPAADNQANWPLMAPLLRNPTLKPQPEDILFSLASFRELLAIRKSSTLFRLRTADDIHARVTLLNGGPNPEPGLIVTTVHDVGGDVDRRFRLVATAVNATGVPKSYTAGSLANWELELHPVHAASHDPVVRTATFADGTFTIPARTAAVFVSRRPLDQQVALLGSDVRSTIEGRTTNLIAKLDAAIDRIVAGNLVAAANQLNAFINDVESMVDNERIPASVGNALIAEANAILAQM